MLSLDSVYSIHPFANTLVSRVGSALAAGIERCTMDEALGEHLLGYTGVAASSPRGVSQSGGVPLFKIGGLGIVPVRGVFTRDRGLMQEFFGGFSTSEMASATRAAAANESIHTIVLDINSPGGSVDGLADFADAVFAARQDGKRVVAVGGTIASAAYYIASQATEVYAGATEMVGSIGTRLELYDFSKLYDEAGIKAVPVDSAPDDRPFKSALVAGTEVTDQHIDEFQRIVDSYFSAFRGAVLRGRGDRLPPDKFDSVADGRVFISGDGSDLDPARLGLIDGVATHSQVISGLIEDEIESDQRREQQSKIASRRSRR